MVFQRDLTSKQAGEAYLLGNGLGGYDIVRDGAHGVVYLEVDAALKERIIKYMHGQRAGGRFGRDDDGKWYPIDLALAQEIPGWNGSQTGFDTSPDQTLPRPRGSGRGPGG
jgi:hypothetical protein